MMSRPTAHSSHTQFAGLGLPVLAPAGPSWPPGPPGPCLGRQANGLPSGAKQVPVSAPRGEVKLHAAPADSDLQAARASGGGPRCSCGPAWPSGDLGGACWAEFCWASARPPHARAARQTRRSNGGRMRAPRFQDQTTRHAGRYRDCATQLWRKRGGRIRLYRTFTWPMRKRDG